MCVLLAVVSMSLGLLMITGCGEAPKGKPFTIVWNYDTSGYLEPCGCSSYQLGGLPRRATQVAELRKEHPVLAIEGARNLEEGGAFRLFKSEIMVKSLNAMKYDAIVVGVQEAQHGASGIKSIADLADFPVVSANLKVEGASWIKPFVVKEVAGNRVAVTGASQVEMVDYDMPEGIGFEDPLTAIESVLTAIGNKADLVVLCLEGETGWIDKVTGQFRDRVDLFLTGDRKGIERLSHSEIMKRAGFTANPPLLNNLAEGRYLGIVEVQPKRGGKYRFTGSNLPLEEKIADDAVVHDIMVKDFRPQLENYFAEFTGNIPQTYLPAKACSDCHPDEYEKYTSTGHFQAMATLEEDGQLYNPDCMGCHLSYNPEKDHLETMHCVGCHGNIIWDHAFQAEEGMVEMPDPPVTAYTLEWCERCHDPGNSLPFEKHWPQYVHQIYHGGDKSAAVAAAERMGLDITQPPPDFASAME
jgi:hypothetical protein